MLRVSVLIPAYNRADYLSLALETIFRQSYAPHEVIVVDDGSADHTADLMRNDWPTVRYIRHEHNLGVSAARNRGVQEASGEVIAWLDADDLWEPTYLETVMAPLLADPAVAGAYTGYYLIDSQGQIHPPPRLRTAAPADLYASLLTGNYLQTSAMVMRKTCFEQVGLFDDRFGISEDYDMWLRLAKQFTLVGIPQPLVHYRVLEDGTQSNTAKFAVYQLGVIEKHFGPAEGDPSTWPPDKQKAYAYSHRLIALRYLDEGNAEGWQHLNRAVEIWPDLLLQLDTPYELACSGQSKLSRGQAAQLDLPAAEQRVLNWLNELFQGGHLAAEQPRGPATGQAYLALAMLSDQAGDWPSARRYLRRAIQADRQLVRSRPILARLVKLSLGKPLVGFGRRLRGRFRWPA